MRRPWRRWAVLIVVSLYLVTWVVGVPSVLSSEAELAAKYYRGFQNVDEGHPRIRFEFAVPILPGVILVKHHYQVAWLCGWGGWTVYLWYGSGKRVLVKRTTWVS